MRNYYLEGTWQHYAKKSAEGHTAGHWDFSDLWLEARAPRKADSPKQSPRRSEG